MQPPLPASVIRAQDLPDYVPLVDEAGWERWNQQSYWVLEADEVEPLTCQLRLGGRERAPFPWRPGTWHLYAPGTGYHVRYPLPARAHRNLWVIFDLHAPPPGLRRRAFAVFADATHRLAPLVARLHELGRSDTPGAKLQATGTLLTLLGLLTEAAGEREGGTPERPWVVSGERAPGAEPAPSLLGEVDRVVGPALPDPPDVPAVARALGLSVSSLAHRLRAETGWTVVARVRHLRVREAQRRLQADPELPLKALARALGFSSPQYLIRVFRETTGVTPGEFAALAAYRRRPLAAATEEEGDLPAANRTEA